MKLRDANPADLPAIVAIYNDTIASRMVTADTTAVDMEERRSWFEAHDPLTHPLWVLDGPEGVDAWLSLEPFYGRPAYHATAEVSIYVAAAQRRRGFGRRLLDEAVRRAPELGLETLLGFIFSHNRPSLELFQAFGFQQWGMLPDVAEMDGRRYSLNILGRHVRP